MRIRKPWETRAPAIRLTVQVVVLLFVCAICYFVVSESQNRQRANYALSVGSVSTLDITAPSTLTYVSEIQTENARNQAESRVSPVYLAADQSISRDQVAKLRDALGYIASVKADSFSSDQQKAGDISNLNQSAFNRETIDDIIRLNAPQWESVRRESLVVLEQVMRSPLKIDDLPQVRSRLSALVSLSLTSEMVDLVANIVSPYISPNSLYSAELTEQTRQTARSDIEPVSESFVAGQIIVRKGQLITPLIEEALLQYNLSNPHISHLDNLGIGALIIVLLSFVALYMYRRKLEIVSNVKGQALITINFLVFLIASRVLLPDNPILPFVFPIQAFGLTMAALFHAELAFILSITLGILAGYGLPSSLDITIFYLLTSAVGILALSRATRIAHFFRAGLAIGLSGIVTILAYKLVMPGQDIVSLATLALAAVFSGIASASLALLLQYIFSQLIGITTPIQLLEVSRPDHPLLQLLLRQAPGSYQHSLQVSILAEQAAEVIGADALLARVGSLYHDVGKAANPSFFIENQAIENLNPHDDLDPVTAAQTIIRHVPDGVALAKKYNLPKRMHDFILEHHGTSITRYLYGRALLAAGGDESQLDIHEFQYPGPIPQSRETAILMLADITQARMRAELPRTESEIEKLVNDVIHVCQNNQQLNAARITMKDLTDIAETFVVTIKNTYHHRIQYPQVLPTNKTE